MRDREREREREAETQAEGEAGSMQGARCGTRSRVSRITPWAAGGAKPLRHQGCPEGFLTPNLKWYQGGDPARRGGGQRQWNRPGFAIRQPWVWILSLAHTGQDLGRHFSLLGLPFQIVSNYTCQSGGRTQDWYKRWCGETVREPGVWSWRPWIESHIGLPAWSLLLPLPVSLPLSLSLSLMNK